MLVPQSLGLPAVPPGDPSNGLEKLVRSGIQREME
jgi:hypothetical protein